MSPTPRAPPTARRSAGLEPPPDAGFSSRPSALDSFPADTAITLRTADLASLLPAVAAWYGLTPREREVLAALGQGMPAKHIARDLALAISTVNAHLQSIYRKAGVRDASSCSLPSPESRDDRTTSAPY